MKICRKCRKTYDDRVTSCLDDGTALHLVRQPRLWKTIGSYRLLGEIGHGGMGTVYRAEHLKLKEIRALKVISADFAKDREFVDRFIAEARIMRTLKHPNIVRVEDAGRTKDELPYLAMEYVPGQNLAALIRTEGHLGPIRALRIALQVCAALEVAHNSFVVHRDIKPDNILISEIQGNETVKVVDFGIAKVREGAVSRIRDVATSTMVHKKTRVGVFIGAPRYCSPEQADPKPGVPLDGKSDLYSLGVVMYEMVTGSTPFSSDTDTGLLIHHIQTAPVPPGIRRPDLDIPKCVEDIILKALQKAPSDRFESAGKMQFALKEAIEQLQDNNAGVAAEKDTEEVNTGLKYLSDDSVNEKPNEPLAGTPVLRDLESKPAPKKAPRHLKPGRAQITQRRSKNTPGAVEVGILRRSYDTGRNSGASVLPQTKSLFLTVTLWIQVACLSIIAIGLMTAETAWTGRIWNVQIIVLSPITAITFAVWSYRRRRRFNRLGSGTLWNSTGFWLGTYVLYFSCAVLGKILNSSPIELAAVLLGILSALLAIRLVRRINPNKFIVTG